MWSTLHFSLACVSMSTSVNAQVAWTPNDDPGFLADGVIFTGVVKHLPGNGTARVMHHAFTEGGPGEAGADIQLVESVALSDLRPSFDSVVDGFWERHPGGWDELRVGDAVLWYNEAVYYPCEVTEMTAEGLRVVRAPVRCSCTPCSPPLAVSQIMVARPGKADVSREEYGPAGARHRNHPAARGVRQRRMGGGVVRWRGDDGRGSVRV